MSNQIRIYTARRRSSVYGILRDSVKGFVDSWYLAYQLTKRDIKSQYRQSLLGFFWAIAPVVMSASVWIFLKQTGTINLSSSDIPYPLYVVIGTTIWSILTDSLSMTISTVNGNKSIITKINFQKEALITLGLLKLTVNIAIKLLLVVALMVYYKTSITSSVLLFFPTLIILVLSFISIGILITPIGLLYTDIGRIIPVIMQILMFLTPVVYVIPQSGFLHDFMQWNPISYFLETIRNSLTGGTFQNEVFIFSYFCVSLIVMVIALIVYRISMPIITERMSS